MSRKMTAEQYQAGKRALTLYEKGAPIREAFADPAKERDTIVECIRIAVEDYEEPDPAPAPAEAPAAEAPATEAPAAA